jgi:hypothetical protein
LQFLQNTGKKKYFFLQNTFAFINNYLSNCSINNKFGRKKIRVFLIECNLECFHLLGHGAVVVGVDEDDGDLEIELELLLKDAGELLRVLGLGHATVLPVLFNRKIWLWVQGSFPV